MTYNMIDIILLLIKNGFNSYFLRSIKNYFLFHKFFIDILV